MKIYEVCTSQSGVSVQCQGLANLLVTFLEQPHLRGPAADLARPDRDDFRVTRKAKEHEVSHWVDRPYDPVAHFESCARSHALM